MCVEATIKILHTEEKKKKTPVLLQPRHYAAESHRRGTRREWTYNNTVNSSACRTRAAPNACAYGRPSAATGYHASLA